LIQALLAIIQSMQSVILHVFGHALGLQDEICLPSNGKLWNSNQPENHLSKLKLENHSSEADVLPFQIPVQRVEWVQVRQYKSIMAFPLPSQIDFKLVSSCLEQHVVSK
jgi:hypothetical protein